MHARFEAHIGACSHLLLSGSRRSGAVNRDQTPWHASQLISLQLHVVRARWQVVAGRSATLDHPHGAQGAGQALANQSLKPTGALRPDNTV